MPLHQIRFGDADWTVQAENASPHPDFGVTLQGNSVQIALREPPRYFYRHGWQSWSLTGWARPTTLPAQKPALLLPMQTDPVYASHPAPLGCGMAAVDFADDNVLLLGALGLDARVQLREGSLHGFFEGGGADWFAAFGPEDKVFGQYAELLKQRFGSGRGDQSPSMWCSWYSYYTKISEANLLETLHGWGDMPFEVFQVDDGWQLKVGDWQPNKKFPSGMAALAEQIRSTGRKAGLWLAPLIAAKSADLFRGRPDWFLRDEQNQFVSAGFNWGEPLYALDPTHPDVQAWLAALMQQVRSWGYDYIKLDFLYAGGLPGKHHTPMPREAAYRQGLQTLREAMGEAYFLACGAPVLPSLGLCDGIRVGPDVAGFWNSERDSRLLANFTTPGMRNAIRTSSQRLWLSPLAHCDPDVTYFSEANNELTAEQKQAMQDLAVLCAFRATSDLPGWLSAAQKSALRDFLAACPAIRKTGRYTYQLDGRNVDFGAAVELPNFPRGLESLLAGLVRWGADQKWIVTLVAKMEQEKD